MYSGLALIFAIIMGAAAYATGNWWILALAIVTAALFTGALLTTPRAPRQPPQPRK